MMRSIAVAAVSIAMTGTMTGATFAQEAPPQSPPTTSVPIEAAPGTVPPLTEESLTESLNASDVCTPLSLNVNDVTSLFGLAIPSFLPIDPNIRFNQNAHTVRDFVSNEGTFEATIGIGCQPSSNGAILEYVGLTPERLRLPGTAFCAGAIDEAGRMVGADCTVEGRIVPYIGRTFDLEGRLERALSAEAAPAATQEQ